jgi:hypothetical protein
VTENRPSKRSPTRAGLLARLNTPVDQAPAPREKPQATGGLDPTAMKKTPAERTAERSAAHYARSLAKAQTSGDPTAVLLAHVDRIRALRNPELASAAAAALAGLIERAPPLHVNSRGVNSP